MQLLALAVLVAGALAQQQDQCLCSDFDPCYEAGQDLVANCADKCQKHLTDLGASYAEARLCIVGHQDKITAATKCSRKGLGELCATKPGQMIPKRFPETLQIAAFREVTEMATRSGLLSKATDLFESAKKATGCMLKCAQASDCAKKLKCGVALPGDNLVVETVKGCALKSGFTTPVAREICMCLQKAGMKQLEPICPTLTIS